VVTGNHYLLDAAVGIVVALLGLAIALLIQRYLTPTTLAPDPYVTRTSERSHT
jgi:membrane-associated phospholipid phosphatase